MDARPRPQVRLLAPDTPAAMAQVRALMREYADGLGVDLCFQGFEAELASLPGDYAAPRGALFLATVDGEPAGCAALRPLDTPGEPQACEMKRLYVRSRFRGMGLGRTLAEAVLDAARKAGYRSLLLDTLDQMESARALYGELGFYEVPPYYQSPIPGTHYLRCEL